MGTSEDKTLRQKVSEQGEKINTISDDVKELIKVLTGDRFGNDGFIKRFKVHEEKTAAIEKSIKDHLQDHKDKDNFKKGQTAVYTAIGAAIGVFIAYLPKIIASIGAIFHIVK